METTMALIGVSLQAICYLLTTTYATVDCGLWTVRLVPPFLLPFLPSAFIQPLNELRWTQPSPTLTSRLDPHPQHQQPPTSPPPVPPLTSFADTSLSQRSPAHRHITGCRSSALALSRSVQPYGLCVDSFIDEAPSRRRGPAPSASHY